MNNGPLLFLGILITLASSFWGLLLAPQLQIGRQQPVVLEATGETYPQPRPGMAQQGADVYRSLGCAACHSHQVRGFGGDRERGFGPRISVAQDSLHDYPVQLGSVRVGPDLANYGGRQTNAVVIYQHLYAPGQAMPGSIMPPYRYLFEERAVTLGATLPDNAFLLPGQNATNVTQVIVPKPQAQALAAYLISLKADMALYEAPIPKAPKAPKPAPSPAPAATNAPAK